MKYPIGIQTFDRIIEDGYVYVDKTDMVYDLVTKGSIYFLSRPRRFGKSLLVSTLKCYFEGRKELFKGLAIDALEKDWLAYPVFHIDFNGGKYTDPESLDNTINWHLSQWEEKYGRTELAKQNALTTGDRFKEVLRRAHEQTGRRCVVLVDEYDKPILDVLDTGESVTDRHGNTALLEDRHRDTLRALYSTFKGADAHLQFVLLTGVTKFSQVSVFSGFNQPDDISMDERYETLCGITKEELHRIFAEPIGRLAEKYRYTADEMKQELKRRYDGYHFSMKMTDIYNPFSILNVMAKQMMRDYWFSTGTPSYLVRLLSHTKEQLDEMTGKYYKTGMFIDYKADVERPLPMIYQSGYLTIKDVDMDTDTYLLDFPNNEVREGFLTMIASSYLRPQSEEVDSWLIAAVRNLRQGKTDEFRDSLTAFLSSIPYDAHEGFGTDVRLTEKHFQYTFYLLLRLLGVYCLRIEERQSRGRVDCILEMKDYVYIFEFKLDGTAAEALAQIEAKGYARPYAADSRKVIRIGVTFSTQTRTVGEWEEAAM